MLFAWTIASVSISAVIAETIGFFDEIVLNTLSVAQLTAIDDDLLDTRSYTRDWSLLQKLDTLNAFGTIIQIR